MKDKTQNYTKDDEVRMISEYQMADTQDERDAAVAALAESLGKTPASVRAKLAQLKVYVPKNDVPRGKNTIRKSELVARIAEALNMDEDAAGSLEKATKVVLTKLLLKLNEK